jgi:hypothetical protein
MEWKDLLQQLIDLVKQTAPEVWRIALLQVRMQLVQYFVFGSALMLQAVPIVGWAVKRLRKPLQYEEGGYNRYRKDGDTDQRTVAWVVFSVSLFMALVAFFAFGPSIIQNLMNPEYQAIKVLMGLVK